MPFVKRDQNNQIVAVYKEATEGVSEEIALDDKELQAFFKDEAHSITELKDKLTQSDLMMVRVIEDLIDVLIEKDVINITDLPNSVIEKLSNRKRIRKKIHTMGDILSDDEGL